MRPVSEGTSQGLLHIMPPEGFVGRPVSEGTLQGRLHSMLREGLCASSQRGHPARSAPRAAGLLQKKSQDGAQTTMEATLMAQQTPQQRDQVLALRPDLPMAHHEMQL